MSYRKYLMTDDVPPSELYKTVKIDTDSDTISRAKAIEAIDEIESEIAEGLGFEYEKWRKYFCDLPPAQPEQLGANLAEVGTDCISRQAAIDAINCVMAKTIIEAERSE